MLIMLAPPETEAEEKYIWGINDSKLSHRGHEQAIEFARDLWFTPHHVYIAPADHIVELVLIILPLQKPVILPELTDRSMGSLTGRNYRETMVEFPRRNWLAWQRSYWTPSPQGESMFDISDRVITALRTKILPIPSADNTLIICAADVIRLIIGFLAHMEENEVSKISVESMVPYVINGDVLA